LSGNYFLYDELEKELAHLYQREAALVFTSGYHANVGILPALADSDTAIFSDRLNHASIIDGMILSGVNFYRYQHLNYDHLEELLRQKRGKYKDAIIISESVFSMDGDVADLSRLIELKERYRALLYLDEAHAVGVLGEKGLGLCEKENFIPHIDIIMGTLGKALASLGAFAVMDIVVREYLINKMRPFIFTTALPPLILNWNLFVLQRLPLFRERRDHLSQLASLFRKNLTEGNLTCKGESHIIPVIIGENEKTLATANFLREKGYFVLPIRPPTVPRGSARLRLSLQATMMWEDLEPIAGYITEALQ